MFMVDDATAATIRRAFGDGGELSAVAELRRHFPGITDNAQARLCVRSIAGWTPRPPGEDRSWRRHQPPRQP